MAKKQNQTLHIHDAFFKELMSDLSVAKAFFEAFLPPELLKVINLDTLKPTNISKELRKDVSRAYRGRKFPSH